MVVGLLPEQITIAVTVFNRRAFLRQAVSSALGQTAPVKVIVVEDCGPDSTLRDLVKSEFGERVEYFRNAKRRGIFGNANACIELCSTPWLSILHDDDYLAKDFVEAMVELHRYCPGSGLYFGSTTMVNERGEALWEWLSSAASGSWRRVTIEDVKWATPFAFAGQLLNVENARAVGGFRESSQYCGDWEMWCKLVARFGGACTRSKVAFARQHGGEERGTVGVIRSGREYPLNYVQLKRAFHLARLAGVSEKVNRVTYQKLRPISRRFLLRHGASLSPRLLAYHRRLLLLSASPHVGYRLFQFAVRLFGPTFLSRTSKIWNRFFPNRQG